MKTIASAQADFRANDRDWNHENDYWREDVAGLYAFEREGHAIKLIELSVAAADDRPMLKMDRYAEKSPKAGFWYRGLPHAGETTRGPDRFAACAFPVSIESGRRGTYVISEDTIIRRGLLGRARGIEVYPGPAELIRDPWEKME